MPVSRMSSAAGTCACAAMPRLCATSCSARWCSPSTSSCASSPNGPSRGVQLLRQRAGMVTLAFITSTNDLTTPRMAKISMSDDQNNKCESSTLAFLPKLVLLIGNFARASTISDLPGWTPCISFCKSGFRRPALVVSSTFLQLWRGRHVHHILPRLSGPACSSI